MGLDAWIIKVPKKYVVNDFRFRNQLMTEDLVDDFFYWRKNWAVQEWFELLYKSKGGKNQDFNGAWIRLVYPDLKAFNNFIINKVYWDDQIDYAYTKTFVDKAVNFFENEKDQALYYCSSW